MTYDANHGPNVAPAGVSLGVFLDVLTKVIGRIANKVQAIANLPKNIHPFLGKKRRAEPREQ
jgi:hypothetical protein